MSRSSSRFRPVTSLLASSMLAILSGCGGNSSSPTDKGTANSPDSGTPSSEEKSLFVVGAQAIDGAQCVAKGEMSAPRLDQGVLDLAFTSSYTAFLLVGNQLAGSGSSAETERVSLRGAEVTLTTADGTVLKDYSAVGTGFVDAATGSAAYGTMSVVVIPPGLATPDRSGQLLVAKIRVLGQALNGTMRTSSELDFPIRVCTGCLVQYPPEAADPSQPAGSKYQCATDGATTPGALPPPCVLGQDVPFSCVNCAASFALCRDPSLNPSFSQ